MEELLQQDEMPIHSLAHGDIVEGTVVRVDPDEVLVDIGAKSEGIISKRELNGRGETPTELVPGEQIKVYVLQPEDEDGNVILSLRRARAEGVWQTIAEKESDGEVLDAEVKEQNKGGLIVSILGLRGFLPSSQVARQFSGNLLELVGTRIPVKVLEVNRKRNRLIVSQRAAQDEDRARQREELFKKLSLGDMITGKVSGLTSYGAFINLGGADGLIHISELSWDRVNNVSDVLAVGDEVSVKVIKLDPELSRISLSLRQLSSDPWDTIEDSFPAGKIVEGVVTKTKKYGAFLQIADGVEGLLHISELSWDHVERTEDVLKIGETIKVMVLSADKERRRISLSLRQMEGNRPEGMGDLADFSAGMSSRGYDDEDDGSGSSGRGAPSGSMVSALSDAMLTAENARQATSASVDVEPSLTPQEVEDKAVALGSDSPVDALPDMGAVDDGESGPSGEPSAEQDGE